MKTLNQLYKDSGAKGSFKEWLQKGQMLYNQKKEEGRIAPDISFEMWANAINQFEMNADAKKEKKKGKVGAVLKEAAKAGVKIAAGVMAAKEAGKAGEVQAPVQQQPVVQSEPKPKKTILGLQPPVFYAVAGVTILAVSYGVYRIIKSKKSS